MNSEQDDEKFQWIHPGDLGTILLAGVFLVGLLGALAFLFSSPSPVNDFFKKPAAKEQPNVVDVTIPQKN